MMGIAGARIAGVTATSLPSSVHAAPSSGFTLPAGEARRATAAAPSAPAAPAGMLALQEWQGDAVRDREARRRGEAILAALAALQRALLGGGDDAALERLAALTEDVPEAADPRLATLVRALALRARVELARHENGFVTGV